ncbi:hypothetical protein NC651_016501 [Populus alba x Populus x berolinensis]|nr:hypothetical protein NC651_016501 [Populus alba x Populus x berolinensis]
MLCPLPPARLSPLKELAGGSSPDKYLIYSKDGFVLQHIDSSPSAEDHVLIEDCFDEDDFEEDEVDYSTTKGRSKFFLSPVPNPTGKPMDATLGIGLRATPLDAPEKSAPSATRLERDRPSLSTTKSPIRATSSGFAMAEAGSLVIAPHAEASQLGTSHPLEPIGKWRDLFASNCNTVSTFNRHRIVFYCLGLIAEPSLGSAEAHIVGPSHNFDPMSTEAVVAIRE